MIIKERIRERLLLKPQWYKYLGRPITMEWIDKYYD